MNSAISQQQLDILFNSMSESVPLTKVLKSLEQTYNLSILEKNNFYHGILELIKKSSDPKDTAMSVLQAVEDLLKRKADIVLQDLEVAEPQITDSSKKSPIFRRIG